MNTAEATKRTAHDCWTAAHALWAVALEVDDDAAAELIAHRARQWESEAIRIGAADV